MPEPEAIPAPVPPTGDELHERARAAGYGINVFPQDPRASFGSSDVVDTEHAWQWNVRYRNSTNMASGHSCRSPHEAFDQALAALRSLVPEIPTRPTYSYPMIEVNGGVNYGSIYASGGYTSRWEDPRNAYAYDVITGDNATAIQAPPTAEHIERIRAQLRGF